MAHRNARLTVFGRLLLVQRVTELGWQLRRRPRALGVAGDASKWLARHRTEAEPGWPTAVRDPTGASTRAPPPRCGRGVQQDPA